MKNKLSFLNIGLVVVIIVNLIIYSITIIIETISFFEINSNISVELIYKAIPHSTMFILFLFLLIFIIYGSVSKNKINKLLKDDILKNGDQYINIDARVKYKNGSIVDIYFSKNEDLKED